MGYGQLYQGGAARYAYNIRPPNYLRNCIIKGVIGCARTRVAHGSKYRNFYYSSTLNTNILMPEPSRTRRNQAGTRGGIWMEPGVHRTENTHVSIFVSIDVLLSICDYSVYKNNNFVSNFFSFTVTLTNFITC